MSVTTVEFEQHLKRLLESMESWKRCGWCGCDDGQKRIGPRSKLCEGCKEWRRKERIGIEWQQNNPGAVGKEEGFYYEYCIQFAALCREEGQIHSWRGPITPLQLEWQLQSLTEPSLGKRVFGSTIEFGQFSEAQRRLLMYMLEQMTKARLRHRRRGFATDAMLKKHFPSI